MKFGQLIELNITNIFLKNYTQNVVEKPVTNSFIKIISLNQQPEML